ncbi:uncharacterized protein [Amphiura filiformis]|uniref:uncharacterized protein n=1 Tax=Amphiura filiformis TaxID=82378 RepID=UPI003B21B09F
MNMTAATKEDIQELLNQFKSSQAELKSSFTESLQSAKEEFWQENKKTAECFEKKLATTASETKWKREGNKRQYEFNQSVDDLITKAIDDPVDGKVHLLKARDTIGTRQKFIRLADISEHGWATVSEYETNELAADEDDHKRIQRAEYRAGKKIKQKQASKQAAKKFKKMAALPWVVVLVCLVLLVSFFVQEGPSLGPSAGKAKAVATSVGSSATGEKVVQPDGSSLVQTSRKMQEASKVIFQSGIWSDAGYEEHDELNKLASELPGVTLNSRADSTIKQYGGAFCSWCTWADRFGKSKIPADPYYVSLYLIHVSHSANTPAPILKATAAISWAHKLAGSSDPCLSPIVKNAAEGLKRKLASPTVKKEPITAEILVKVYDHYCADLSIKNLLTIRTVTMCLIAYAGFLRFDELSEIKREHVTFELSHMSILIPSSKTDIYRQGKSVIIARLTSRVCPVRMLQKYLELAQVQDSCSFIFRSLSATKMGYKLRKDNRPMSYTRVREVILDALKPIVGDTSKFGVHSLRSGGATEAANAGVPERLFKRHGRWRSDSAKDGYVKESLPKLLSVSQSLGL